jgi:hypothetical protein
MEIIFKLWAAVRSIVLFVLSPFIFFFDPMQRFGWQTFKTLSDGDRQELQKRLDTLEERYNSSRNIGIDILKLYLQTVITMVVVPLIFKSNIQDIFRNGASFIYWAWIGLLISIIFGFLAYFCIFEGTYHMAHFYSFIYLAPFFSIDEPVQKRLKNEQRKNQVRSHIFLELSHLLGIGAILSFCVAMLCIVRAVICLFG